MHKVIIVLTLLIVFALSGCSEQYPEVLQEAVEEVSPGAKILAGKKITTTTAYRFQFPSPTHSGITMHSSSMKINDTPVVYTIWCLIFKTSSDDTLPMIFFENDRTTYTHVLNGTSETKINAHEYYLWNVEKMMKAYDGCYDVWNLVDPADRSY